MDNTKYQTGCRYFNGYKPCSKYKHCDELCPKRDLSSSNVLVMHLGAIGAVVRTTALLPVLKQKFPKSKIIWLTSPSIKPLLDQHPLIDEVYTSDWQDVMALSNFDFDMVYAVDKSKFAGGILRTLNFEYFKGFYTNENGKILPADEDAHYLWQNGLSDEIKFYKNKKSEIQMIFEAMGLDFNQNEYCLPLTETEEEEVSYRRNLWLDNEKQTLIGLNTGCSPHIPYKKISDQNWLKIIHQLKKNSEYQVVLLGGPEDQSRNEFLAKQTGAISSPTNKGLRDGLVSIAAMDVVVSGDSLGMHMAISQKKYVVAWFGPTCAHEIELYGRGEKVVSDLSCAPCWKRACNKSLKCNELVNISEILEAISKFSKRELPDKKPIVISNEC